jgi:hypothetical protein
MTFQNDYTEQQILMHDKATCTKLGCVFCGMEE